MHTSASNDSAMSDSAMKDDGANSAISGGRSGWIRRLVIGAGLATAGLVLALPGIAVAGGGGATGNVEPNAVRRGDTANFFLQCPNAGKSAFLDGSPLGLPNYIAMDKITSTEFDLDVTITSSATRGTHHLTMSCADGSSAEVTLVVTPHGGADTGDGSMSGGASTSTFVIGGILIVGAGAGGVLMMRRRRTRPGQ